MSDHDRGEHKQINAMPEGPQKDLAVYMHMYSYFPDEPVFDNPTYNDELVRLTYDAGGSFYRKDGKLVFHQMSVLELDNWWVDDHLKEPEYEKLVEPDYEDLSKYQQRRKQFSVMRHYSGKASSTIESFDKQI